jgi:hypothetical protein
MSDRQAGVLGEKETPGGSFRLWATLITRSIPSGGLDDHYGSVSQVSGEFCLVAEIVRAKQRSGHPALGGLASSSETFSAGGNQLTGTAALHFLPVVDEELWHGTDTNAVGGRPGDAR